MQRRLLLRGGLIYDGAASPPFRGDLLVEGDRIAFVSPRSCAVDAPVVDCGGLCVCPGFIDIHSHSDCSLLAEPPPLSKVSQGVTTEAIGNCGLSGGPLLGECGKRIRSKWGLHGVRVEWESFGGYLDRLERASKPVNVCSFVGHNNLRASVRGYGGGEMGECELGGAISLLREALGAGAFGLSTGLMYPPGIYSSREEVAALAGEAAAAGALYATHLRDEGDGLLEAVEEALDIGRMSGAPVHICHIKAYGRDNWGKLPALFAMVEEGRSAGLDVSCDRYPYTAAQTGLDSVLPGWVHEGGIDAELRRLRDSGTRRRLAGLLGKELDGEWGGIVISFPGPFDGRSVEEAAVELSLPPAEALLQLVVDSGAEAEALFFRMSGENLVRVLGMPYVMVASDSSSRPFPAAGRAHPRSYGTFPRALSRFAAPCGLSMEEAVNRMTGMPAERLGLRGRGFLREGSFADITVFAPGELRDAATYEEPERIAEGVRLVFVNGELVWENGRLTGKYPGKVLRKG